MKFPFPFKSSHEIPITTTTTTPSSWRWPICTTNPRTLSFRAAADKTMSPAAYLDQDSTELANATPDESVPDSPQHYQESAVISAVRSDRLFFDPGATSSIVEEAKEESVVMVVIDSMNPFVDFRVSMEEMVEAGGVRDLEELLEWYLRVNDESNHGCIVGAFLDLLIHPNASSSSSSSSSASFTSPLSFSSSMDTKMDHPCFISPV